MAGEVQFSFSHGQTTYFLVRNNAGQVWNTNTSAFENYLTANFANYAIGCSEEGTASSYYIGNFPSGISAGSYNVVAKQQLGGSAAETDPTVAVNTFQWNGSGVPALSDLITSGQLSQLSPIRIAKGVMVQNFPVYLKSATDHITPFTSGILSGQIAQDSGSFGALQSGAFIERGLGFYTTTLTSGDLNGNTIRLIFTGTMISGGGTSDPLPLSIVTQKVSGST